MGVIVKLPADRHLDQLGLYPEMVGLAKSRLIAAAGEVGWVVAPHHAAVVAKAMRQQEIDGGAAQIPGRRAVTLRPLARQAPDRLVGAYQIGLLLLAAPPGI